MSEIQGQIMRELGIINVTLKNFSILRNKLKFFMFSLAKHAMVFIIYIHLNISHSLGIR